MKVLLASSPRTQNSYVNSIADALSELCNVTVDEKKFSELKDDIDILHIQWPEELIAWRSPLAEDLQRLEEVLIQWKKNKTRIVLTAHNTNSHLPSVMSEALYSLLYQYADGIIHLGSYSLQHQSYPNTAKHVVIFHPNYTREVVLKDQETCKQQLGIPEHSFLYLSFGKMRHKEEEELVRNGFLSAQQKNTTLLLTNTWRAAHRSSWKTNPISRAQYTWQNIQDRKKGIYVFEEKVKPKDISMLFSAADVIILPRINTLNSGVQFLAYSYGKPVIGPRSGNITEFLERLHNPVFQSKDIDSVSVAFQQARILDKETGHRNKVFVEEFCNPTILAKQHKLFYESLQ